jgi:methionyl-tRNA synthetase
VTRYLITSALPYINGTKHLGNFGGSMLPADVYARYLRLLGHDVRFICGTDEHGTPAELAAADAGLPVSEYCLQQHNLQKSLYRAFSLSFDHFGRSSSPENRELTQYIGRKLADNGYIEERVIKQVYSLTDQRFLPDRYVIGTCPYCGYTAARGDQCENCTRLLDPTQLILPYSAVSGSTNIELRESKHLYLIQSRLAGQVRQWIESHQDWPILTTSIALKWLNEGLEDRGITRDLKWGVPVDRQSFEGKVYYVWFDAPIEYIAATKEAFSDWKSWWYDAADVQYIQFMAKDNIPFHTIMFPAALMGTGEPWKLADYIKGFNWLNYYGGKFSTSRHYGVFMNDALEILPADYWRYFLIANAPESADVSFTWEHFSAEVNSSLANTLGNFVNRVVTFSKKYFGDLVPNGKPSGEFEIQLGHDLRELLFEYNANLDGLQFRKAASSLRTMWDTANQYLNKKAPWIEIKEDPETAARTICKAMNLIFLFGIVSAPIIPESAKALTSIFILDEGDHAFKPAWPSVDEITELSWIRPGTRFDVPELLFRKISDEDVNVWRERFGPLQ